MKSEILLQAIGHVRDEYIAEAIPGKKAKDKNKATKWVLMAACTVLVCGIAFAVVQSGFFSSNNSGETLPKLAIDQNNFFGGGGMSFEGHMAHDIAELVNANPWTADCKLKTLPVFRNTAVLDENGVVANMNMEAMKKRLLEIARRFDVKDAESKVKDNYPDEEEIRKATEKYAAVGQTVPNDFFRATRVYIQNGNMKIEVDSRLGTIIEYNPAVKLPQEYHFTYTANFNEMKNVAEYLKKEYRDLIAMNNPVTNIHGGEYTIYNQQSYNISFYEKGKNQLQSILNYNFFPVEAYCDDNGEFYRLRICQSDLSQKIGDYPIITVQEAERLLTEGKYITSVPEPFPGKEFIKKTELVYRTVYTQEIFLPFYRIYVEMPTMKRDYGLKTYGIFYVPAVEEKYLEKSPTWADMDMQGR